MRGRFRPLMVRMAAMAAMASAITQTGAFAAGATGNASVDIQDSGGAGFERFSLRAAPLASSTDDGSTTSTTTNCSGLTGFSVINPSGSPDAVTVPSSVDSGGTSVDDLSVAPTEGSDVTGSTPYCMSGQVVGSNSSGGPVLVPVDVNYN